jgi:hypothetical protein
VSAQVVQLVSQSCSFVLISPWVVWFVEADLLALSVGELVGYHLVVPSHLSGWSEVGSSLRLMLHGSVDVLIWNRGPFWLRRGVSVKFGLGFSSLHDICSSRSKVGWPMKVRLASTLLHPSGCHGLRLWRLHLSFKPLDFFTFPLKLLQSILFFPHLLINLLHIVHTLLLRLTRLSRRLLCIGVFCSSRTRGSFDRHLAAQLTPVSLFLLHPHSLLLGCLDLLLPVCFNVCHEGGVVLNRFQNLSLDEVLHLLLRLHLS